MPCYYEIFPDHGLVVQTMFGRVTTKCVLQQLDEIEADPAYRRGMVELSDLSQVVDLDITATDIEGFAQLALGMSVAARRTKKKAIFAPGGPARIAAFGFSKMVEGADEFETGVFDNVREALAFLGYRGDDKLLLSIRGAQAFQ